MFFKKVFIMTNGCPENRIDVARTINFLESKQYAIVDNCREADLLLFNTCALTQTSEDLSVKMIEQLKSQKKAGHPLFVYGCLPKININRLREVYDGTIFESDDIQELCKILGTETNSHDYYANYLVPRTERISNDLTCVRNLKDILNFDSIFLNLMAKYHINLSQVIHVSRPHSYCIKISTGCLGLCTFCAVRLSRGRVRSKTIENIKKEFEEGLEKGYKEFALLGTDLGAYGRDIGISLVPLLRELVKYEGDYEIRLRNIQPRFLKKMLPDLMEILETGKISFLSSAAESGNNRILKLMNRMYTIEEYKQNIKTINDNFPEIFVRTQLMVGFPSETDEEFQDTYNLLDELRLDYAEVYNYQTRPNTKAFSMESPVPQDVAVRRETKLLKKSLVNEFQRKRKALKQYKVSVNKHSNLTD
ncbi:MiaB/RimO family radical SAM methylthiotransferase [candidate division KSB1 bacterium]|nr:MiaB/RimO family radical SAM methylthiotransferase [candidate division KSB1 bacterium]